MGSRRQQDRATGGESAKTFKPSGAVASTDLTDSATLIRTTSSINDLSDVTGVSVITGESGTGKLVRVASAGLTTPSLTNPTISGTQFTNANHAHLAANSGGTLTPAAVVCTANNVLLGNDNGTSQPAQELTASEARTALGLVNVLTRQATFSFVSPTASKDYLLDGVPVGATVTECYALVKAATSVVFSIVMVARSAPWSAGTDIVTGQTATTTGGTKTLASTTYTADTVLRLKTSTVTGTPEELLVMLKYTVNA